MKAAASLTSALLVAKGAAAPSGKAFWLDGGGNVEILPRRPRRRSGSSDEGITRMSLRLTTARHLRLRLAAAHLGRSHHALALAAIDHYIDTVLPLLLAGRCACLEQGRAPEGACTAFGFGRATPDSEP